MYHQAAAEPKHCGTIVSMSEVNYQEVREEHARVLEIPEGEELLENQLKSVFRKLSRK